MPTRALLTGIVPLLLASSGCAHVLLSSPTSRYDEDRAGAGRVVHAGPFAVIDVGGSHEQIGAQLGALSGGVARTLLDEWVEALDERRQDTWKGLLERGRDNAATIPERYRAELLALANASEVSENELLAINTITQNLCTVVVALPEAARDGELVVARNMDFGAAHLFGPATGIFVVRGEGRQSFVSIGWPGFLGVTTGMNESGLTASILLNSGLSTGHEGTPIAFRVREILEQARTVAEAIDLFGQSSVDSDHYVVLADSSSAAVVSWGGPALSPPTLRVRRPAEGLLTCSNSSVDDVTGVQTDRRARCLSDLTTAWRATLDAPTLRRILGASYVEYQNCQAVVFVPETRTLQLALGTTLRPASTQDWYELDLRPVFAGESPQVREIDTEPAFAHYTDKAYPGTRVDAALVQGYSEELVRLDDEETLAPEERIKAVADLLSGIDTERAGEERKSEALEELWARAVPAFHAVCRRDMDRLLEANTDAQAARTEGDWAKPVSRWILVLHQLARIAPYVDGPDPAHLQIVDAALAGLLTTADAWSPGWDQEDGRASWTIKTFKPSMPTWVEEGIDPELIRRLGW